MSGTDKDISIADLKGMGFTDKDIEGIEKGNIHQGCYRRNQRVKG